MGVNPTRTDTLWVIPLSPPEAGRHMIDGHAAVGEAGTAATRWQQMDSGLPADERVPDRSARGDGRGQPDPAGVYFGTSTGQLFGSADEGDDWQLLADYLPDIWSVEAAVVEA